MWFRLFIDSPAPVVMDHDLFSNGFPLFFGVVSPLSPCTFFVSRLSVPRFLWLCPPARFVVRVLLKKRVSGLESRLFFIPLFSPFSRIRIRGEGFSHVSPLVVGDPFPWAPDLRFFFFSLLRLGFSSSDLAVGLVSTIWWLALLSLYGRSFPSLFFPPLTPFRLCGPKP